MTQACRYPHISGGRMLFANPRRANAHHKPLSILPSWVPYPYAWQLLEPFPDRLSDKLGHLKVHAVGTPTTKMTAPVETKFMGRGY